MSASPLDEQISQPSFTPNHQAVREPMFPEHRELLERVADGVRAIDFDALDEARETGRQYATVVAPAPDVNGPSPVRDGLTAARGSEPLFDAATRAHWGTGPQPSIVSPAPPVAEAEQDGTWLLDFLGDLLDDAAEGAGRRISEPCESCPRKLAGWCEECQDALARAARYSRLAELVEAAPGDRAAVLVLMAGAWRQTVPEDAPVAAHCGTEDESTSTARQQS